MYRLFLFLTLLILFSCSSKEREETNRENSNLYATHFSIEYNSQGERRIEIDEANFSTTSGAQRLLIEVGELPDTLERVVVLSTTHLPYLKLLGVSSSIVAISGLQYISDLEIRESVKRGEIVDIGFENSINYEQLIKLKPQLLFAYGIGGENNQYIEKIRELGIEVVVINDYLENHPLGKAEYLKLFGALYNRERLADSLFNAICDRYEEAKARVSDTLKRVKVLVNAPWKEIWYIPGEENYMSHLIRDAGGELLASREGESHSSANSLENIITAAYEADYWLNPNFYNSLKELRASSPLFKNFPPLKEGGVYNNNKRETKGGGSDFWERGVVEPDLILNDLITIFHPHLGNKKELVYYKLLK